MFNKSSSYLIIIRQNPNVLWEFQSTVKGKKKIDHLKNANIQVYKLDAENRRKSKIKQENIKEKRMYIFNNY